MLDVQIIEASKAWRDSWRDILGTQERLINTWAQMYAPIIGGNDEYQGHIPVTTPSPIMGRTSKLQRNYEELRTDLLEEINNVELRIIKPAQEAKDCIQPLKKVIKKRGDRKVRNQVQFSQQLEEEADGCSWILKNTRIESTQVVRRRKGLNEIMQLWRRPKQS